MSFAGQSCVSCPALRVYHRGGVDRRKNGRFGGILSFPIPEPYPFRHARMVMIMMMMMAEQVQRSSVGITSILGLARADVSSSSRSSSEALVGDLLGLFQGEFDNYDQVLSEAGRT